MVKGSSPIKFRKSIPRNMKICFWPGKLHTNIRAAVAWFTKEYSVKPMYVVAKSKSLGDLQSDIRMWHEDVDNIIRKDAYAGKDLPKHK